MGIGDYYNKFDGFLVDRANEAVKAWNWTTGRTRADLAKLVAVSGVIPVSIPLLTNGLKDPSNILPPLAALYYYNEFRTFCDELDRKEMSSDEVQDMSVEGDKLQLKIVGPVALTFGGLFYKHSGDNRPHFTSAFTLVGISSYIMRAEPKKPRKDCVRRGIENAAEIMRNYREAEQSVPAEVRS